MTNPQQKPATMELCTPDCYNRRIRLTIEQFPGMPAFVAGLLRAINKEETDIGVLSEQIRTDPGITTNLLRLANSAAFGTPREITSVREAIVRLGMRRTVDILIALHVAGHLSKPLQGYELSAGELTMHSLWAALASEEICRRVGGHPPPEYVFTAALLHDIGKVLLSEYVFQEQAAILRLVREEKHAFDEAEKKLFGCDHGETGAAILRRWNFPEILVQAAEFHHRPDLAPGESLQQCAIIHYADVLSYCQGPGAGIDGFSYHFCEAARKRVPLHNTEIEHIAGQTLEKVNAFRTAFDL